MKLGRASKTSKRKCVIRIWHLDRCGEVRLHDCIEGNAWILREYYEKSRERHERTRVGKRSSDGE